MKLKHTIILLFLLSSIFVTAQSHSLSGRVTDLDNGAALSGVSIQNADGDQIGETDTEGNFKIQTSETEGKLRFLADGYLTLDVEYNQDDYLNVRMQIYAQLLGEVKISAYSDQKTNKETAGAISVLNAQELKRGSGTSMATALNSIPGVRIDQSTLSDARLSIRGNGVRSQYGIRDIKIYINDIPVTEADGTTRIEGLDFHDLGRAEIIRGPASSIYGGGIGGVINFSMERSPYQEQSLEAQGMVGSYGLSRFGGIYRNGGDKMNSYVSYGWQEYKGYREHSHDIRNFITGNFQFFPSDNKTITLLINRTTQKSEIPGAIGFTATKEDRRQANPTNLDKNARRDQEWTRIGLGQKYKFSSKFTNTSSVFSYFYHLDHPLPYAYLHGVYQSFGGRTLFDYNPGFEKFNTKIAFGGEFNQAYSTGSQYENVHGTEGDIRSDNEYKNTLYSFFIQTNTTLTRKMNLALGVNYTGIVYNYSDYLFTERSGKMDLDAQASPRVALSYDFGSFLSLHASVSSGFSAPTTNEISNVDGSVNRDLKSQKAVNYEINAKGSFFGKRLNYDLALYSMDMKNELIPQNVQQGITIYRNSGKTEHKGIELALDWFPIRESDQLAIKNLKAGVSFAYSHFRFTDYKILDADNQVISNFDGNKLTGIAPITANFEINMDTRSGIYSNLNCYYSDKAPLNDANTDFNDSWTVLNAKIGYKTEIGKSFVLDIFGGTDNLTNTKYSSFVSLNAASFGGQEPAYYNPNPEISFYGGFSFKYLIK